MTYFVGIALWAGFLLGAVFYTGRARHPCSKPVAAYLIFVTVFTTVSFVLFAAYTIVLHVAGVTDALDDPSAALVFLLLVFGPALLTARWQMRKPPRRPRMP